MCANACETAAPGAKNWKPSARTSSRSRTDAVGGVRDAAERLQDVGVHVADERAEAGPFVDVLHDHEARRRDADDVGPPVGAIVVAVADRRRRRTADPRGDGVADHRRLVRESGRAAGRPRTLRCAGGGRMSRSRSRPRDCRAPIALDELGCQNRHGGTLLYRRARRKTRTKCAGSARRGRDGLRELRGRGGAKRQAARTTAAAVTAPSQERERTAWTERSRRPSASPATRLRQPPRP